MGKYTRDRMQVGEITVIKHAIMDHSNGGETHCGQKIVGFRFCNQRTGGVHLDVWLGNHRSKLFVPCVDGKAFKAIGRLGKKHRMEPHPNKVIAKNAGIHAVVQALDPSPRFLIVVNLMFGSTPFSLRFPLVPKLIFVEDVAVLFGPISQSFASGSVDGAETGQLPEVLRELRDFR